jgi:hypothetical protein
MGRRKSEERPKMTEDGQKKKGRLTEDSRETTHRGQSKEVPKIDRRRPKMTEENEKIYRRLTADDRNWTEEAQKNE